MTRPVLAIGELLVDLIVQDGAVSLETAERFLARAGGAPANVAVALARQGVPAAFCGVCGDDPFGRKLRAVLERNGVETASLRTASGEATSIAYAWKDRQGDGHFQIVRLADRLLSFDDVEHALISECAAIVVGSVALAEEPSRSAIHRAVAIAAAAAIPVCLDLNVRPSLWNRVETLHEALAPLWSRTTLLKLSLDDARALNGPDESPDSVFDRAAGLGIPFIVLTDGARGCWYPDENGRPTRVPAFSVTAVEPTGAGDAFTAGLLGQIIAGGWRSVTRHDIEFAAAAGAITATREGAIESLPTRSEILEFLDAVNTSTE